MASSLLSDLRRRLRPPVLAAMAAGGLAYGAVHESLLFAALGLLLAAAAGAVLRWPRLGVPLIWALVLGSGGWALALAPLEPASVLATGLPFASFLIPVGFLLAGRWAGVAGALLCFSTLAVAAGHSAALAGPSLHLVTNQWIVGVVYLSMGLAAMRGFDVLQEGADRDHQSLLSRAAEVQGLAQALFVDLGGLQGRMDAAAADWPAGAATIDAACTAFLDSLRAAAKALMQAPPPPAKPTAPSADWDRFWNGIFLWFMLVSGLLTVADLAMALRKGGPTLNDGVLLTSMLLSAGLMAWRPGWGRQVRRGMMAVFLVAMTYPFFWWGFDRPAPDWVLLAPLAFFTTCFDGPWLASSYFILYAGLIAAYATHGAFSGQGGAAQAVDQLLALVAAVGGVLVTGSISQRLQAQRAQEQARVAQALRRRQRLASTLFHDIRNLLNSLLFLLDARKEGAPMEGDKAKVQGLVARIGAILLWAYALHESEDQGLGSDGASHPVEALVQGLQESFMVPLRSKALTLRLEEGHHLRLQGRPELLRDVLLGNLLSNAMKFTPPGGTIRVGASLERGQVRLWVRDEGQGFSARALSAVGQGIAVASTPGTGGETGYGLGLSLVRGYLEQLGGELQVGNAPEGGGVTALLLPAAA